MTDADDVNKEMDVLPQREVDGVQKERHEEDDAALVPVMYDIAR